jgi:hypothetical protein
MSRISSLVSSVLLVCAWSAESGFAQDTSSDGASDAAAQAVSAPASPDPRQSRLEHTLAWGNRMLDRLDGRSEGLYPEVSGLIPGTGISLGPGYRHRLIGSHVVFDGSAAVSTLGDSMWQATLERSGLLANRLSVAGQVKSVNFRSINYFGVGSASSVGAQTDYALKDTDVAVSGTMRLTGPLAVGGMVGYLTGLGVANGHSSLVAPIGARFDETSAPGLAIQPRYEHSDVYLEANSLDVPGYPTSGGRYRAAAASYHDLDGSGHSFNRFDVDGVQYIPLFHRNWIVALRGRVSASETTEGNAVPFYLMPSLGSEDSLRGYADYRFRDRSAALFSAEYRWPVFSVMDAALFGDTGAVAPNIAKLWPTQHSDFGFGIRFHSTRRAIARVDVAKSPEGMRLIASLHAPLRVSRRDVAPYVP